MIGSASKSYVQADGILMLNVGDGKTLHVRVKNVHLELSAEMEEYEVSTVSGITSTHTMTTRHHVSLDGDMEKMIMIDPKATSSPGT